MFDPISLFNQEAICRINEEDESLAVILGLAILGAPMPFQSIRTYLTCEDLAGHPWFSSPWIHLRRVGND